MIRLAAALRHPGMDRFLAVIKENLDEDIARLAKRFKIDTARPDFLKLRAQDIEWVTGAVTFSISRPKGDSKQEPLHRFEFGNPVIRMVAPFDWLAFLRQWRFECEKVHAGGFAYYKLKGPLLELFGPSLCVFLPDDRTIVFDDEATVRKMVGGAKPSTPAYLGGPAWSGEPRAGRPRHQEPGRLIHKEL